MNKQRITTKQLALCSVLLTLMLVLGWVESLFPPLLGVPGIKLGLSNGVLIFAVYMLSLPTAWVLMLLKVVLSLALNCRYFCRKRYSSSSMEIHELSVAGVMHDMTSRPRLSVSSLYCLTAHWRQAPTLPSAGCQQK